MPSFPQNIFSVQAAAENGASVCFKPNAAELIDKSGAKFDIHKHGRLYYLHLCNRISTGTSVNNYDTHDIVNVADIDTHSTDLQGWHKILGHCNFNDIMKLEGVVDGMKVIKKSEKGEECEICMEGKMTNERKKAPRARSEVPLQLVHTDIAGPITQLPGKVSGIP